MLGFATGWNISNTGAVAEPLAERVWSRAGDRGPLHDFPVRRPSRDADSRRQGERPLRPKADRPRRALADRSRERSCARRQRPWPGHRHTSPDWTRDRPHVRRRRRLRARRWWIACRPRRVRGPGHGWRWSCARRRPAGRELGRLAGALRHGARRRGGCADRARRRTGRRTTAAARTRGFGVAARHLPRRAPLQACRDLRGLVRAERRHRELGGDAAHSSRRSRRRRRVRSVRLHFCSASSAVHSEGGFCAGVPTGYTSSWARASLREQRARSCWR